MRTDNDIKDTIDKKEGEYVYGGSKDRKATINAYFKRKEASGYFDLPGGEGRMGTGRGRQMIQGGKKCFSDIRFICVLLLMCLFF